MKDFVHWVTREGKDWEKVFANHQSSKGLSQTGEEPSKPNGVKTTPLMLGEGTRRIWLKRVCRWREHTRELDITPAQPTDFTSAGMTLVFRWQHQMLVTMRRNRIFCSGTYKSKALLTNIWQLLWTKWSQDPEITLLGTHLGETPHVYGRTHALVFVEASFSLAKTTKSSGRAPVGRSRYKPQSVHTTKGYWAAGKKER